MGEVLIKVLIAVAVTSVLSYFFAAARRAKPQLDPLTGFLVYRYVLSFKAFAVASLILPAFMLGLWASLLMDAETSSSDIIIWGVISAIFLAMSVYMLLECFVVRIIVSDDALTSISPWTGRRKFEWSEIDYVSYSATSKWFIIGGRGMKIRASEYLAGIHQLTRDIKQRVPEDMRTVGKEDKSFSIGSDRN